MVTAIVLLAWWVPGLIAAGLYNAYYQRQYPELASVWDWVLALSYSLAGTGALTAWVIHCNWEDGVAYHGWSLMPRVRPLNTK